MNIRGSFMNIRVKKKKPAAQATRKKLFKLFRLSSTFYANGHDCFFACGATRMCMNETRMDMNILPAALHALGSAACHRRDARMCMNETRMDINKIYEHSWVIHEYSC